MLSVIVNSGGDIKRKTVSGFFWRLAERIGAQAVTFVVTVVLARFLMPEDYGIIAIVNVFVAVADVLVTSGLSTSLIQRKDACDADFSSIFYVSLLMASVLYAVLFLCAPLVSRLYDNALLTPVLRVMGIKFFISAVNSVQQAFVARMMIFRKFFFATLLGTLVSAVVGIALAVRGFGVWALVAQTLTNPLIDTVVLFITVRWHPRWLLSIGRLRTLVRYGWKLTATSLIGTVFEELRALVIGIRYSYADLAFYNRGYSLPALVTNNIVATLDSVLFPALSAFQDDADRLKAAVRRSISLGSYVLSPLLIGLAVVADKVVFLLYGDRWIPSVPFVRLLCLANLPAIMSSINVQAIKASGRSGVVLALEFIKKPVFLAMVLVTSLISPVAMAAGAVVYGLLSCLINSAPNLWILRYSFLEMASDLFAGIALSAVMGGAVWLVGFVPLNALAVLGMQVVAGGLVYVLLSMLFRVRAFFEIAALVRARASRKKGDA